MAPAQRFAPAREALLRRAQRYRYQPDYRATNVGISFENYLQQQQMGRQEEQRRRQEEKRRRQEEEQRKRQEEEQRKTQEEDRRRARQAAAAARKALREKENRLKAKKTLLYREKILLNQLAKLSPSPRKSPNASPINNTELAELYERSRKQAKKQKMRAYRRKMLNIGLTRGWEKRAKEKAERSPPKRKKIRSRKRKLSPKKQPSKRRRVVDLILPKPNAATARKARRRVIEKRKGEIKKKKRNKPMILFDLITGKEKIYTSLGWYERAIAKQNALRARICA